ncbi:tRNA-splicing ligase [Thermoanaerobaculum aquaticum]|uniref:tRNA-splicing ligase RtcB n=1 Tax=Thermoanaerobaculum aquaticum TaxID=1312852 RepID=A0A062XX75_9BACT|nr:RtcB family protein [Thermoanaerobaculum aquaticum]KDA54009.1 tRNA-splicing ligase [Thermoanaerobaculum aquaticum]
MSELKRVRPGVWEVAPVGGMRVPARIFATEKLVEAIKKDQSVQQACNVAHLPGIVRASLVMPDVHEGYGFPIGGVAAFDLKDGVISPGGVGYDINCGVRLIRTDLSREELDPKLKQLVHQLQRDVPAGVGSEGAIFTLSDRDLDEVMVKGARWAVERGFGQEEDLAFTEAGGALPEAKPQYVSARARERGAPQVGTLGSGNHFCEIQVVEEVYDEKAAKAFGLAPGLVTFMIHCGSRGLGYQVCDDFLDLMRLAAKKYGIDLPDPQLVSVPVSSPEGERYLGAMRAAANFAWANRQVIMALVERALVRVLGGDRRSLGFRLVYDVAHNIAKVEEHVVDGKKKKVIVHRKGATRAFPAHHPETPAPYKEIGQPVLIPGDMGRASYVLVGTEKAMSECWGSSAHGAGRMLSRTAARRTAGHRNLVKEMGEQGVIVAARSPKTLAEEMPEAYKDVSLVVEAVEEAGIAKAVAKLRPIGVVKG